MFKQSKPQQPSQPSKSRLPAIARVPKQEDVAGLLTNALRIRGCLFELPVRLPPAGPNFLIACVFDVHQNETIWSMFRGDEISSGSQPLWSCPNSDLDMVLDMICMACGPAGGAAPAQIPPELANTGSYTPPSQPPQQGSQGAPPTQPQHQQPPPQTAPPQPYPQQYPGASGYGPQGYPPVQGSPAPYPNNYPQQQQPYQAPYGHPQFQQAPYPAQNYPPPGQQQQQPPQQHQQQAQQQQYYPDYQQGQQQSPQQNQSIWNTPPANYQGQQAAPVHNQGHSQGANTPPTAAAADEPSPEMVSFINLIDKSQPNLLLGHLFVESGMVPEKCLDAALKLQEYVRQGKITNESAIIALKRLAVTGSELSEELIEWAKNPDKSPPPAGRPSFNEPRPRPRDNPAMQKVIELLQQAGLVSEADLETARKVKSKHGGDLGQILVSAGKIGGKTLEAATECQIYIQHSRLRVDKAIMALHYCERMRVGFKEACEELTINLE